VAVLRFNERQCGTGGDEGEPGTDSEAMAVGEVVTTASRERQFQY